MLAAGGVEAERRVAEGRRAERRETAEAGREGGSLGWDRGTGFGSCSDGVGSGVLVGAFWDWDLSWWSWSS